MFVFRSLDSGDTVNFHPAGVPSMCTLYFGMQVLHEGKVCKPYFSCGFDIKSWCDASMTLTFEKLEQAKKRIWSWHSELAWMSSQIFDSDSFIPDVWVWLVWAVRLCQSCCLVLNFTKKWKKTSHDQTTEHSSEKWKYPNPVNYTIYTFVLRETLDLLVY